MVLGAFGRLVLIYYVGIDSSIDFCKVLCTKTWMKLLLFNRIFSGISIDELAQLVKRDGFETWPQGLAEPARGMALVRFQGS